MNTNIDTANKMQSVTNKDLSDTISHYYCELAELELSIFQNNNFDKAKKYINKAISYNNKSLRALISFPDAGEISDFLFALKLIFAFCNFLAIIFTLVTGLLQAVVLKLFRS